MWQQTLAPLIKNDKNRKLKYPLESWDKVALKHWKWYFSESYNTLFARYGKVFTAYEMNNRGSSMNTNNYVVIKGICTTLPEDIKDVDVYKD